jgi:thiamine biosynthesis lipoprotein
LLDVVAIAKGWAAQQVAKSAPEGLLISVGGNVCATGPKDDTGTPWVVGIENPNGGAYLHTIYVSEGSVVTSGDYQRAYVVDGALYHHIIDPETRYPSRYWRSVTIVCPDSALADALSTALFLIPLEEGRTLAEKCGVDALWVDHNGEEFMTAGFRSIIRK